MQDVAPAELEAVDIRAIERKRGTGELRGVIETIEAELAVDVLHDGIGYEKDRAHDIGQIGFGIEIDVRFVEAAVFAQGVEDISRGRPRSRSPAALHSSRRSPGPPVSCHSIRMS